MKAIVIRSPWIELILAGKKTWEMRTKSTNIKGRIALIKAKSGLIYGTAELAECLPSLSLHEMHTTQAFHGIPDSGIEAAFANRWTTPWVLRDVKPLKEPTPYTHPKGAVTWVELPDFSEGSSSTERPIIKKIEKDPVATPTRPTVDRVLQSKSVTDPWADVCLTEGNLRNSHFYLRSAESLLPKDCIGGSSKSYLGKTIRVTFQPGMSVECDVAGDKMILRARSQVRDFFERAGAKAGDIVRFMRVGNRQFLVTHHAYAERSAAFQ
jgi:hypothetical protein